MSSQQRGMQWRTGSGGIDPHHRERIGIVFADHQREIRYVLRGTVMRAGYRDVQEYGHIPSVRAALVQRTPDLVIIDAELPEGDACQLITDIRNNKVCDNPFVPVIITAWQPDTELVLKMVNSGADDLLVKPISPTFLLQRIEVLAAGRKPFVVTSEYIGPDRRRDAARSDTSVMLFDVPNTLALKARGETIDPAQLSREIAASLVAINDQRLKRNAYYIAFAVGIILDAYREKRLGKELHDFVDQLGRAIADTLERLPETAYDGFVDRVEGLSKVAQMLRGRILEPDAALLEMLKVMSSAILEGFNPEKTASELAEEVADNIKAYAARKRRLRL